VGGDAVVPQDSAPLTRHVRVHRDRGCTVLTLSGEIDIAAAEEIGPCLDRATDRSGARVVIDLSEVDFFDCSGLRLLYRARGRLLERGGELRLVCTDPLTLRILKATGLARLTPVQPTLQAALSQPGTGTDPG